MSPALETAGASTSTTETAVVADLVSLGFVEPRPVDWLWKDYLPCGTVALLSGEPGVGKTFVALAIAAAVTQPGSSAWITAEQAQESPKNENEDPDEEEDEDEARWKLDTGPSAGNVLYIGAGNPAQLLRPRLDLLGGDPRRFQVLRGFSRPASPQTVILNHGASGDSDSAGSRPESVWMGQPDLPYTTFLQAIENALAQTGARLLVIDPLESYLPARKQDKRAMIRRLMQLAEEHRCCILLVRQLVPGQSDTADRRALLDVMGSLPVELTIARSPYDFANETDATTKVEAEEAPPASYVLVPVKSNFGPPAPPVAYLLGGEGVFRWIGPEDRQTACALAPAFGAEQQSALREAMDLLQTVLEQGPAQVRDIQLEARQAGISATTLQRAKERLGIRSKKVGESLSVHSGAANAIWRIPVK